MSTPTPLHPRLLHPPLPSACWRTPSST